MSNEETLPDYSLYCVQIVPQGGYWGPYECPSDAREAMSEDPDACKGGRIVRCRRLWHEEIVREALQRAVSRVREELDQRASDLPLQGGGAWRDKTHGYEVTDAVDYAASEDLFLELTMAWAKACLRFEHFENHPIDTVIAKDAEFAEYRYREERVVRARRLSEADLDQFPSAGVGDWLIDLAHGHAIMTNEDFRSHCSRTDEEDSTND